MSDRAAGIEGRPKAEKTAKHVVVDTCDLCRFLGSLPVFSRQAIVEVHFLLLIHDAQGGTAGFYSNFWTVTAGQADTNTLRADAYAAGVFLIRSGH